MRIYSKFKDYYDGALAYGHDETVHYQRLFAGFGADSTDTPAPLLTFEKALGERLAVGKRWGGNNPFQVMTLGFCGKIYRLAAADYHSDSLFYRDRDVDFKQFYGDLESLHRVFPQVAEANSRIRSDYSKWVMPRHLGVVEEQDDIFLALGVPVFAINPPCYGKDKYELNPTLKNIGFFRLVEPFQAFQQLEQYLSNVLLPRDVEPEPQDNRSKIISKGFDTKTSFRKPKA